MTKGAHIQIRVSEVEKEAITAAASADFQSVSEWLRRVALDKVLALEDSGDLPVKRGLPGGLARSGGWPSASQVTRRPFTPDFK